MKCVSLFSGAGGLDLGFEAAGFQIVKSIETDSDCCQTLQKNGRTGVTHSDVTAVDYSALAKEHEVDVVIGGPPCQPFSKSALWTHRGTRGLHDPRTATIAHFARAVAELRPRAFVLENVEGFAKWGGIDLLEQSLDDLLPPDVRYTISTSVLNAADFGVPQKRKRFFAVGMVADHFTFPERTHGEGVSRYLTANDACSVATCCQAEPLDVKGRWAALLPSVPAGRNYLWHTDRGGGLPLFGWRTRYWSFLYKLDPDAPSPTIVANPSQNSGPFHWDNRLLSTGELASIQTFPAKYMFHGGRASRQRQIGNAVPPLLAEHVARALMLKLGGCAPRRLKHKLQRNISKSSAADSTPVPDEYLNFIGLHKAHPGAGLGPKPRPSIRPLAEALA